MIMKDIGQNQIVKMALMTGNQNQGCPLRRQLDSFKTGMIDDDSFENGVQNPAQADFVDINQVQVVIGGDFIQVLGGFLMNPRQRASSSRDLSTGPVML